MSTKYKEDLSQILSDCQAKLVEIDHKLSQIKNRCRTGKTKHKYSLHTNEDFIILKKEAESLESDIQFVKTLLEETTEIPSSFPLRLMKKVFPSRMFSSQNKPATNEIKAKIIAHSTALLEEKVKVLQTIANSKKKKRKPKPESKDSVESETSNSAKPPISFKPRASSDSEILMNPEKISSLKVLSSLKEQHHATCLNYNSSIETDYGQKLWTSEISKFFTPTKDVQTSNIKSSKSQTEYSFTTYSEQHVQTMESCPYKSTDKYVQTDFPIVTWVNSVINKENAQRKYVEKETNTDNDIKDNKPAYIDGLNDNFQLINDSQHQEVLPSLTNILDINEIDNIINNLLYSPLKMLQCKHIKKISGGNVINPPGYVNLIIRQSDFMPLLVSGVEERTKKICKKFFPASHICFAYTYHVKHTTYWVTLKYNEMYNVFDLEEKGCSDFSLNQYPAVDYSSKVGKTEFSVHCKNAETNKKFHVSNTLQIDYKNPQTSGRIVLTEFGDSQTSTQSETISRILTHLIGLPNSIENK